jgi:hypothetical protein
VGLDAFARAFRKLVNTGVPTDSALATLAKVEAYDFADSLWVGVLWNQTKGSVIPKSSNRELAAELLLYKAEVPIVELDSTLEKYRKALDNNLAELP